FSPADTIPSTSAVASRAMLSSCPCPGFLGDFDSDSGADQRSDASYQDRVLGDLRNTGAALRLVKFPEIADAALHQLQQGDRAIVLRDLRRVARQLASRHCRGDGPFDDCRRWTLIERLVRLGPHDQRVQLALLGRIELLV